MEEQNELRPTCYVAMSLIGINIVVFVLFEILGSTLDTVFMLEHGAMYTPYMEQPSQWYRFFTSLFLHFGMSHLLNNMLLLYALGNYLERYLGRWKFLVLYLGAGVGANVLSFFFERNSGEQVVSAGASGAVFANMGGLIWVILINKGKLENLTTGKMLFMAVLSLYFGFASQGVDNTAHLGGLILGFVFAIILYRRKPQAAEEWT